MLDYYIYLLPYIFVDSKLNTERQKNRMIQTKNYRRDRRYINVI